MKTPVIPAPPTPAASISEFIATFAVILATVVGLVLFDTALARIDSRERKVSAAREFAAGEQLVAQGKSKEAIEHLRTASTLDGENTRYATALADAVLADGRPNDAELLLVPLLERNATDGAANLTMARVLFKQGKIEQAKAYYHRAIYGLWPRGAEDNRTAARFELIDLLASTDARQELLAELLPIQDDSTNSLAQRKRIAHLFVVAGSPSRAVTIFRDVLRHDAKDADAYIGLAEAALSLGDFATAKADLVAAQKLSPQDSSSIQARISVTDSVIALDPTQRGLSLAEQYRRSRNLVQLTLASVRKCLGTQAPDVAAALGSAGASLVASAAAASQSQSIDQTLLLAEQLWALRRGRCAAERQEGALALVQNKITK
ncbi:MAG TPA: tetratricopeptide repeat protein [Gemmatimonadaceae bacterium]